jgi:hypothetical protein
MIDPWIPLLSNLPLSRTEREVVKRYESDPQGRTFLPVADILRSHRLVDESLELLTQGVERHPTFTVARVVLARELLQKGMVAEAWRALEESPVSLRENLLAQKLRFRLAVLMGLDVVVKATYQHLTLHQMLDADTKRLGDMIELSGLAKAREKLIKDLRERGVDPVIPAESPVGSATANLVHKMGQAPAQAASAPYLTDESLGDEGSLIGFHVVPLEEIFRGSSDQTTVRTGAGGIELDSTTLADIYARQGHYAKALAVYRRLLRLTPNNDLIRRKVAELAKLEREQRDVDLTVDPAFVDRMESVEIIDRQIRFYNDLLARLT